uniref:ATP synthase membrane subunit f n=1 Tax=Melopsittacus undulatus TaxID=13146 RepID=A0A8C6J195_MELUD
RRLMDVRLGELPLWVTTRDLSPQALLGGAQRAWNSYYNKYINVKKGGPAGISMLLAGYCLLSYAWNYQHISKIPCLVPLLFQDFSLLQQQQQSVCHSCYFEALKLLLHS